MQIEVIKLEEAGFESAMRGLSLNKKQRASDMEKIALQLAPKDYGHNKFLENMMIWSLVRAPRYWWQDADTYRLSTKQSESTNHTILRGPLSCDNFEDKDIDTSTLLMLNTLIAGKDFYTLKRRLPEGFLQSRVWCFSYKTFTNIVRQRMHHKLPHWSSFIRQLRDQLERPEFIDCIQAENE